MRTLPGMFASLVASLVASLAACAATDPGLRTATPPQAAAPADIDRADLTFQGRDGLSLYAQRWRPRTGEPHGVIVIHHGLADLNAPATLSFQARVNHFLAAVSRKALIPADMLPI